MVTNIDKKFKEGDWVEFSYIEGPNKYVCLDKEMADNTNLLFKDKTNFKKVEISVVRGYYEEQLAEHKNKVFVHNNMIETYKTLLDKVK